MDRWVLYKGVFGCWGWERLDTSGRLVEESNQVFGEFDECVQDAKLHGYTPSALPELPREPRAEELVQ
jgi:hypothetical protein